MLPLLPTTKFLDRGEGALWTRWSDSGDRGWSMVLGHDSELYFSSRLSALLGPRYTLHFELLKCWLVSLLTESGAVSCSGQQEPLFPYPPSHSGIPVCPWSSPTTSWGSPLLSPAPPSSQLIHSPCILWVTCGHPAQRAVVAVVPGPADSPSVYSLGQCWQPQVSCTGEEGGVQGSGGQGWQAQSGSGGWGGRT